MVTPAIAALTLLSQSCTTALAGSPAPPADSPAPPDTPPLPVILADLDALFALVYNLSTKLALALALKPASPAYSAATPVIHDLTKHTAALAHCIALLHDNLHGATLVSKVSASVKNIVGALRALVQTFLNNAARGPQLRDRGASGEEYLVKTATLHDLITAARSPSGIPRDNQAAVSHAWKSDMETLEDNLQEIAGMITCAESDTPQDDLDDGWDEIGLGHATQLSKDELARVMNIHQILRLTTLLHRRIFLDILAHPSSAPVSAFDTLLSQSNQLVCTSDDLVAALYSPQDPNYVHTQILQLSKVATLLHTQTAVFLPATKELTVQLHALNIDGNTAPTSNPPKRKKVNEKWLDTCVDQIIALCANMSGSLGQTENPIGGT